MSDKMIDQFKSFEDIQAFAKAQQKTLIELTKKNKKYEDEIKHLQKLLEATVPVINVEKPSVNFSTNDEESIAREQLFRLKQISNVQELTYEETKKVEIFTKILMSLKDKPKTIEANSKLISNDELMKLMDSKNNDDTSFK